jgi:hypothetical protein
MSMTKAEMLKTENLKSDFSISPFQPFSIFFNSPERIERLQWKLIAGGTRNLKLKTQN